MKANGNIRPIISDFAADINKEKIPTNEWASIQFRDDIDNNIERPVYKISTEYLHFRKDNGRIASDVLTYESSKGELNEATDYGQTTLKTFLERKDPEKNKTLLNSIIKYGQREIAVVTADGFLINGNRRKLILEKLQDKYPEKDRYRYLKVVILPGLLDKEKSPTFKEIEQIENRYQLQNLGKAEYYNFDKALSIKRKIEFGMNLEDQLLDDPNFIDLPRKQFDRAVLKFKNEFLEPLNAIDRYLLFFDRVGHYDTISEGRTDSKGRWQAFRDYYNSVYKKIDDPIIRKKLGFNKKDAELIEDVAFKIIRKRELGSGRKVHNVMRELLKIFVNKDAKEILSSLRGLKDFKLEDLETIDEKGMPLDERTKDLIWSNKFGEIIISAVYKAYTFYNKGHLAESPMKKLQQILELFNKVDLNALDKNNLASIKHTLSSIKKKIDTIEKQLLKMK